ncbi:MAG: ribonuclease domain-containing protein [Eubacteriales bacterium]|nr:ribonuclease domain-containing protein [Eubacteriales bacterium]
MKKLKLFLTTFLLIFVLAYAGCGSEGDTAQESTMQEEDNADTQDPEEIEAAFEDELIPLEGDELALMEESTGEGISEDDEMVPLDEDEMEQEDADNAVMEDDSSDSGADSPADESSTEDGASGGIQVKEDGTYTGKEEVAVYIHTYGHLPSNYITKKEAQELGWVSSKGNLDEVAPGKSIGGDKFGNYDKMLPEEDGRTYQECDIDFDGGFRNEKRIVYSSDGLIFYTEDHYETFEQLY